MSSHGERTPEATLGLLDATMIGMGAMIGAGIFVLTGLAAEVVGGAVQTIADVVGDLEVFEIRVADGAPAANKRLADIALPAGSLVVSGDDGNRIARPDTTLDPGKRYVVAVEPAVTEEVMNLFRG
nr:TrkA C-terminal domain-containing protein [Halorientalis litorea]